MAVPMERKSACSARDLEEYEGVKEDTKLEDCSSVEVEMRNGKMGVKYVKGGEMGWSPVLRKRKSARSEESESSRNLNVNGKRRILVRCRKATGSQEFISKKI